MSRQTETRIPNQRLHLGFQRIAFIYGGDFGLDEPSWGPQVLGVKGFSYMALGFSQNCLENRILNINKKHIRAESVQWVSLRLRIAIYFASACILRVARHARLLSGSGLVFFRETWRWSAFGSGPFWGFGDLWIGAQGLTAALPVDETKKGV